MKQTILHRKCRVDNVTMRNEIFGNSEKLDRTKNSVICSCVISDHQFFLYGFHGHSTKMQSRFEVFVIF